MVKMEIEEQTEARMREIEEKLEKRTYLEGKSGIESKLPLTYIGVTIFVVFLALEILGLID